MRRTSRIIITIRTIINEYEKYKWEEEARRGMIRRTMTRKMTI